MQITPDQPDPRSLGMNPQQGKRTLHISHDQYDSAFSATPSALIEISFETQNSKPAPSGWKVS